VLKRLSRDTEPVLSLAQETQNLFTSATLLSGLKILRSYAGVLLQEEKNNRPEESLTCQLSTGHSSVCQPEQESVDF
jgi:hypothetical protein